MISLLQERIFSAVDTTSFSNAAIEVFRLQAERNTVYREFLECLRVDPLSVERIENIPFLPVEFFRNRKVVTGSAQAEIVFRSSSTTGSVPSKHYVSDLSVYERSFTEAFRMFYGDASGYLIAALLPSYTEREGSSLVYMAEKLIKSCNEEGSGFYRENSEILPGVLRKGLERGKKVLLLGVSFALLDLAERSAPDLSGVIVMETGGMKGRRREITREELHAILTEKFNVPVIHSEYGMTELLSQAYSAGLGLFRTPSWMRILIRDPQDPLSILEQPGVTGGINIIDLANINSCSFLSTSDLGKLHVDGSFEVLGRFDNSDIRGCNLMAG